MENSINNDIKKSVTTSPLSISRVYSSNFQKEGTITAELKQVVTTVTSYPSKRVSNSIQDNIFDTSEFGFKPTDYTSTETRVAWMDVPTGTTVEQVQAKLSNFPKATLYRTLANRPILSDSEKYAVNNPEMDVELDNFANSQVVRYPRNHDQEGQIALDTNGKVQYRRVAFSSQGIEDTDVRTVEPSDFYISEEMKSEMNPTASVVDDSQLIGG